MHCGVEAKPGRGSTGAGLYDSTDSPSQVFIGAAPTRARVKCTATFVTIIYVSIFIMHA